MTRYAVFQEHDLEEPTGYTNEGYQKPEIKYCPLQICLIAFWSHYYVNPCSLALRSASKLQYYEPRATLLHGVECAVSCGMFVAKLGHRSLARGILLH
jgi:hypothetical protein